MYVITNDIGSFHRNKWLHYYSDFQQVQKYTLDNEHRVGTPTCHSISNSNPVSPHMLSLLCTIRRYTSQQRCLSLSYPSLATNSSLCSQLQTKRRFPSQHLNKRIYAISHAYQTYQLTNGGQVEQREFCI